MGEKHKRFREFWTSILLRVICKNPRSMYARVSKVMAQFVLKIETLSHIMGPTPILEMARAYGLRPRLWLLMKLNTGFPSFTQITGFSYSSYIPFELTIHVSVKRTHARVPPSISAVEPGFGAWSPLRPCGAISVYREFLHRQLAGVLVTIRDRIGVSALFCRRFLVLSLFAFRGFPV